MAPRKATAVSTLSALAQDYSDDDIAHSDPIMLPTPDSQSENKAPAKRRAASAKPGGNAKAAGSRVVKSKATTAARRTSSGSATAEPKARKAGIAPKGRPHKALEQLENVNDIAEDTEEVDEFEEPAAPAVKKGAKNARQPIKKTIGRPSKRAASVQPEPAIIPDTQPAPEPMHIDATIVEDEEAPAAPLPVRTSTRPPIAVSRSELQARPSSRPGRSNSRQPLETHYTAHRRAGSASDTENATQPALRRKLGDMTRKFEDLDLKYKQLKEVGSSDALSNFDKLRRSTEQRAKDQDDIIASLKKELSMQKELLAQSKDLRKQIAGLEADNTRLAAESKTLAASLQTTQNETKALSAKLAAARSSAQPEAKTVQGSAMKSRNGVNGPNNAAMSKSEESQIMKLKEELYSDLTGLMIRNVKRLEDEDVYDCIQTGRNGTLHFHLSISHLPPQCLTPGPTNSPYDDTEFGYMPLLDEKNDRELLDILPDYLTEEIAFPRSQAAKFFAKMSECMSRKVEFED